MKSPLKLSLCAILALAIGVLWTFKPSYVSASGDCDPDEIAEKEECRPECSDYYCCILNNPHCQDLFNPWYKVYICPTGDNCQDEFRIHHWGCAETCTPQ